MSAQSLVVTVIIPVYNADMYLYDCVESIISQSYRNFELILVNDGSTDTSGAIINDCEKRDSRVRAIHQQNKGVSIAKNSGIKQSSGEYVVFIDADDFVREDFIQNLLDDALLFDSQIVSTPTEICPQNSDNGVSIVYDKYEALQRLFYGNLENSANGIQMFDAQLIKKNKIWFDPEKKVGEDFDFFVKALMYCEKVVVDYRKMYYYRPNPSSVMNQKVSVGLLKAVDTFASIGDGLLKTYPDLKKAIEAKKFNDSVSLAMRTFSTRDQWKKEYESFRYTIDSLKWDVLLDKKVKIRVRLAALVYCVLGGTIGTMILRRLK